MTDIVERLRDHGKDAFAKHYSLGMFKLCADAADEIERLQAIIAAAQPVPKAECEYCKKWHDPRLACPEYSSLSSAERGQS